MKTVTRVALGVAIVGLSAASTQAQDSCAISVLANIDCGGGQATCFDQKIGSTYGAVRCTCTATCLALKRITNTVAATKALQWVNCSSGITGTARGGPALGLGNGLGSSRSNTQSAVFAQVVASGQYISVTGNSSMQVVDCFAGTFINEAPIVGWCWSS